MAAGFDGLNPARTLHEYARDDLQTIGDPVLDFAKQSLLFPDEVLLLNGFCPRDGDVIDRHQESDVLAVLVCKPVRIYDELARRLIGPDKSALVHLDRRQSGGGGIQEGDDLLDIPLSFPNLTEQPAGNLGGGEVEGRAEGCTRGNNS